MTRALCLTIAPSLLLSLIAGCGGARDPNGPAPSGAIPVTAAAPTNDLVIQVTNSSCATIDVSADTPDETVDLGLVGPGETISVNLQELPAYATLSATVVGVDGCGVSPTFASDTLDLGADYTDSSPSASVDWQDPSMDPNGGSSTDTSTSTDSSGDGSASANESVAPGARVGVAGGSSPAFVPRRVRPVPDARIVTPSILKKIPVEPTPTRTW
jgi:hypothetical protein